MAETMNASGNDVKIRLVENSNWKNQKSFFENYFSFSLVLLGNTVSYFSALLKNRNLKRRFFKENPERDLLFYHSLVLKAFATRIIATHVHYVTSLQKWIV